MRKWFEFVTMESKQSNIVVN